MANKSLPGLLNNVMKNNKNIGEGVPKTLLTLLALAGPKYSDDLKGRLKSEGVPTDPAESLNVLTKVPQNLVNTAKSVIKDPLDYAYNNPTDTAMTLIAPMASPQLSAAKVKLMNSLKNQPGFFDPSMTLGDIVAKDKGLTPSQDVAIDEQALLSAHPEIAKKIFKLDRSKIPGLTPPSSPPLVGQERFAKDFLTQYGLK